MVAPDYSGDLLYQYLTVAETQMKGRSTPQPCTVDMIDIDRQLISSFWSNRIA